MSNVDMSCCSGEDAVTSFFPFKMATAAAILEIGLIRFSF